MLHGWHGWFGTFTGVAVLTAAALPPAALVTWWSARRRVAAGVAHPWRKSVAEVGLVYETLPWVWMIMLSGGGAGEVPGRVSLVPLRDLVSMSSGQVVGNLLVFAALGACVPLRFPAWRSPLCVFALAAACSAVLEIAQYVLRLDRVTSVDDVLLNASGAALAALVVSRFTATPARR